MNRSLPSNWVVALCVTFSLVGAVAEATDPALGDRQVVFETSAGTFVIEVFPEAAPQHVAAFLERVRNGFYEGTAFHRAIPMGIIQGGDPTSRDPMKRSEYGTGGLLELKAEFNDVSHIRGTVSAVLVPGNPDSAGSQFFICVTDQVQLDGQYSAFGRVVEGFDVIEGISRKPTDDQQGLLERVEILKTSERDRPPPEVIPFTDTPVEELEQYHAVIMTNLGEIELAFFPDTAPNHVRQFLRFAALGLYDGTPFHRVVPDFVIQGGLLHLRKAPVPENRRVLLQNLKPEFSDRKHFLGTLSMARGEEEDSAMDSFFIVLAPNSHLDRKYTVFGQVVSGLEVVDGIAQVPVRGEEPIVPVMIQTIRVKNVGK